MTDNESSVADDEGFVCDCVASKIQRALPGTPGQRTGYIPYKAVYDTQEQARRRGYWIPGLPVMAKITKVEKDTKSGIHLINAYLYTIELEHGTFKWSVVKRNKDFAVLAARLMTHRAAERIRAPVRRVQERLDDALESVGVDIIPDHREDCPYRNHPKSKIHTLSRQPDAVDSVHSNEQDTIATSSQNRDQEQTAETFLSRDRGLVGSARNSFPRKSTQSSTQIHRLPSLKFIPDSVADPEERRQTLEAWLQAVLHIPVNRNHHETAEFLEVSRYSFINEVGGKYTEGFVKKRSRGTWKSFCVPHCLRWSKGWLILKDTSVCYMDARTEQIRFILLFDRTFEVSAGLARAEGHPSGLTITNQQRELALKCATPLDAEKWKVAILESMTGSGRVWLEPHPYGSTFPSRKKQFCQWFVDGQKYMEHAANMMQLAREEIFIADWWLSPELYLKRPMIEGNRWRLDELLRRKAEQGVRIFVLLYKEMEIAMDLKSLYTKQTLEGLHENIKVMRHRPSHTFLWSHHEKLVIVDQLIAFVGGVDLCYGRWDDCRHKLTDLGSVEHGTSHAINTNKTFVMDEEVPSEKDVNANSLESQNLETIAKSSSGIREITRNEEDSRNLNQNESQQPVATTSTTTATKPLAINAQSDGSQRLSVPTTSANTDEQQPTRSAKRFLSAIRRSYTLIPRRLRDHSDLRPIEMFAMNAKHMDSKYKGSVETGEDFEKKRRADCKSPPVQKRHSLLYRMTHPSKKKHWWKRVREETGQYDIKWMELKNEDERIKSLEMEGAAKLWLGKDYVNFIHKNFVEVDMPFHDFIDRGCTPRMPWHDIHAVTYGDSARDLARHFIQRWNATKTEKSKDEKDYPFLLPKSYDTIKVPRVLQTISECADVQVLRSVSNWSALINDTEDSIQRAYVSLIATSKHCIYIENQFFISLIKSKEVVNEICRELCNRIKRAYDDNQKFRVYIVLPLLPAFEGDVGAPGGSALQAVLHWTFLSLSKGKHSLIEKLKNYVPDPMKYIKICSLRTWDVLGGKLVNELVYVHSKCMIVDDKYTIIGSANINDRSQCGDRDSEVCIVVKDCEFVDSKMNGQPYKAGKYALSLRKHLMSEHLGLLPEQATRWGTRHDQTEPIDLDDPVIDSFFFDTWGAIAKNNTAIFEKVFRAFPTDFVKTLQELNEWRSQLPMNERNPQLALKKLRGLRGVLVEFPLQFLSDENLAPGLSSKEGYVPSSVFT